MFVGCKLILSKIRELLALLLFKKTTPSQDANLFLIGSPKVNKFTATFLELMQGDHAPNWRFPPCPGEEPVGDYEVQLLGEPDSSNFKSHCREVSVAGMRKDYGLIVRGPHPFHPHRMVTIMAGPHSLGTGAACLAATKPKLVCEISERLAGVIDLTTRDRTFWVLVEAETDDHLDVANVHLHSAGIFS
jgi:hypothetical protein